MEARKDILDFLIEEFDLRATTFAEVEKILVGNEAIAARASASVWQEAARLLRQVKV